MSVAAFMVASAVMSAVSTISAGKQARNAAEYDALASQQRSAELRLESDQAKLSAQIEAGRRFEENRALMASNIVHNSVDPYASPSWLALKDYNDDETERDMNLIIYGGQNESSKALLGARGEVISANASLKRGKAAFRASLFEAGGTLFKAGANYMSAGTSGTT